MSNTSSGFREGAQDNLKIKLAGISATGLIGNPQFVRAERSARVIVENAGPTNTVIVRAKIMGSNQATPIKTITGNSNVVVDTSTWDIIEFHCTLYGGSPFSVIVSAFFEEPGAPDGVPGVSKKVKAWFYQDYADGSGPNLTITTNQNGLGPVPFDISKIIDGSAVLTTTNDMKAYEGTERVFSDIVEVGTQTGDSVTLTGIPNTVWGPVRVWYLYEDYMGEMPDGLQLAPDIVTAARAYLWSEIFLDAELNLGDLTNVALARDNLGLGNSAVRDVGTTPGTVADGGDPRFIHSYGENILVTDWVSAEAGETYKKTVTHNLNTIDIYATATATGRDNVLRFHKVKFLDVNSIEVYVTQQDVDARFAGRIVVHK